MTVEVKARLTLDDTASAATHNLKESFQELHEQAEKTQEGLTAMKLVLTELAAHALEVGVEKAKEFGHELIEAASHGQDVEQRLAGMTTAVQGVPWGEAQEGAHKYFDDLHELSIRSMQPIDDIEAGFNRLVEIQGATQEGIQKSFQQTEQMANVARVLGTSVEGIGSQFAFMEEGALKVKSQMYQLLQPTGIFEGHVGKVTEWWGKLTQESRADLLAKGLDKLSASMEHAPPTFNNSVNQLKNVWDQVEEDLGTGVVGALQPEIQKLSKFIAGSGDTIKHYGEVLGDKVGAWVLEAATDFKSGFDFIVEHEAEIGADIKEAWGFARETMEFIIRHKEVLAALAIGKTVAGSELGKGAVGAVTGAAGIIKNAGAASTEAGGAFGAAALGGSAVALGAFTLAIGASVVALKQWDELMAVTGGGKSEDQFNFEAVQNRIQQMIDAPDASQWGKQQQEQFDHMRENLVHLAEQLGQDGRAAGELADRAYAAHHMLREMVDPIDKAAEALQAMSQGADKDWSQQDAAVAAITSGFSNAATAHNVAAQQYVANLLAGSASLQTAFLQSANMSAEGFNSLADMLQGSAKEFAEQLRGKAGLVAGAAKEVKPVVNFNGGSVFKINQEFRDQDPDRIAVLFRNDILKSAERRLQATTSNAFGV